MARKIYVISGPSCSGKGYLSYLLLKKCPELQTTTSYTSRERRAEEREGVDYYFISPEKFTEMINSGDFFEYDEHPKGSGKFYGTSNSEIEKDGKILLELNSNGAKSIKKKFPDAVLIFITADIEKIKERMISTKNRNEVEKRLEVAEREIKEAPSIYDYIIPNNEEDATLAVNKLVEIVEGE